MKFYSCHLVTVIVDTTECLSAKRVITLIRYSRVATHVCLYPLDLYSNTSVSLGREYYQLKTEIT